MTENAAEKTAYTAEDLQKMWEDLPQQFKDAISSLNDQIDEHNKNVGIIKASKEEDTTKLLHEIREQNPENDPELAKFNAEINKLNERIEALVAKANEVAKKYLPQKVSEEDVAKATAKTKESSVAIRDARKGIETFENLMPTLILTPHIKDMQTTRGLALIGSRSGTGDMWRPRMQKITLNGEEIKATVQNPDGTKSVKSTIGILAKELNKRTQSKDYSTLSLQQEYLKAIEAAGGSKENVPDEVSFTIPHTYTDESGNEQTMNYTINIVK